MKTVLTVIELYISVKILLFLDIFYEALLGPLDFLITFLVLSVNYSNGGYAISILFYPNIYIYINYIV